MSVQSEINRINNEVTSQADLIAQIQTALEGKAGGGGVSLETCTVIAESSVGGGVYASLYQCVEGGELIVKYDATPKAFPITYSNVLCGSSLIFRTGNEANLYAVLASDGITIHEYEDTLSNGAYVLCSVGLSAGETGTISFSYEIEDL